LLPYITKKFSQDNYNLLIKSFARTFSKIIIGNVGNGLDRSAWWRSGQDTLPTKKYY